jgi:hypothetical protein
LDINKIGTNRFGDTPTSNLQVWRYIKKEQTILEIYHIGTLMFGDILNRNKQVWRYTK